MKILYCISNNGHGSGGHFHSLNQISSMVSKSNNIKIISIGSNPSPVIQNNVHFFKHIFLSTLTDLISFRREIQNVLSEFNPDVIHFFDTESLNYLLLVASLKKYKIVMNKCGGPNPLRKNWQVVDDLILFSKENYDFFAQNEHKDMALHLIPNRVSKVSMENYLGHPETKSKENYTFMRVSRLGGAYEKTFLDTLNLIEYLSAKYKVELIVVGRIQDQQRFNDLKENAENRNIQVTYITDERASIGASFLYLADFVVGTGRSLMEGLSGGKPCLVPAKNSEVPILLTENNFEGLFTTNFSERGEVKKDARDSNLDNIQNLIESIEMQGNLSNLSMKQFDTFFNIEKVSQLYTKVYQKKKARRIKSLLSNNLLYVLVSLKTLISRTTIN
jgi:glycosyltransferase involved in cell wall biosynthesis